MGDKYAGPEGMQFDVDTRFAQDMQPMVHHNAGKTEYNKPAKTKMARAKMADKAPKIDVRKGYSEGY
jgi:hypothetical protein